MKKVVTFHPILSHSITSDEKLAAMKKGISYLVKLAVPSRIAVDFKSYELFFFLKSLFIDDQTFLDENTKWRYFSRTKFDQTLVRLIGYFSEICDEFEVNDKVRLNRSSLHADLDENGRKICMLDYLIFVLNKLTDLQFRNEIMLNFNKRMLSHKLLEALLSFFKRERYLSKRSKW